MATNIGLLEAKNEQLNKMMALKDKTVIFNGRKFKIYDIEDRPTTRQYGIYTSEGQSFTVECADAEKFIKKCYIEDDEQPRAAKVVVHQAQKPQIAQLQSADGSVFHELSKGLMEKFKALQNGGDNNKIISEANAMIGISKAITNIVRVELSAIKLSKD